MLMGLVYCYLIHVCSQNIISDMTLSTDNEWFVRDTSSKIQIIKLFVNKN